MEASQAPTATDPVCGMTVERDPARAAGLHLEHDGQDFYFCGKGCLLEFRAGISTRTTRPACRPQPVASRRGISDALFPRQWPGCSVEDSSVEATRAPHDPD